MLRNRVRDLQLLDPLQPHLRLRQLLAVAPASLLLHEPRHLVTCSARFAALLPSYDTTHVLMTVMPHLDREPHVTAMNFAELDDVFGRAFGGARVPPSAFAHLLRTPGASVLPPPPQPLPPATLASPRLRNRKRPVPGPKPDESRAAAPSDLEVCAGGPDTGADGTVPLPDAPSGLVHSGADMLRGAGAEGNRATVPVGTRGRRDDQRRYVDPLRLLQRLQELVSAFGRETAYLAVQRHPALIDRDPRELAQRLAQHLAAVDPRMAAGQQQQQPGAAAMARATSRVLEDAPQVLELELGELRRRLSELRDALEWNASQVGPLVLHDPAVLLREPRDCRENVFRLRLYALRRPATWGAELTACMRPPQDISPWGLRAGVGASAEAATSPRSEAATIPVGDVRTDAGVSAAFGDSWGYGRDADLDLDQLALVAQILTADDEVMGRFEYLVASGERPDVGVREVLCESRVKFARQCPSFSRWWAEGAARERGEGTGQLALAEAEFGRVDGAAMVRAWVGQQGPGRRQAGWEDVADEFMLNEWEDEEDEEIELLDDF